MFVSINHEVVVNTKKLNYLTITCVSGQFRVLAQFKGSYEYLYRSYDKAMCQAFIRDFNERYLTDETMEVPCQSTTET